MPYRDNYQKYLDQVQTDISRCQRLGKRIVFGYTSDADVLLDYDSQEFSRLLDTYVSGELYRDGEEPVADLESFGRIIGAYMEKGLGGEADILTNEVVQYLIRHFSHRFSLGGTAAQGAAAMATTGMPLIVHISDRSSIVCDLMDIPGILTVRGDQLVPIREIQDGEPAYHMIFPYNKGDVFELHGKHYTVPCANRMILGYDTIHKDIVVSEDFRKYVEQNAGQMISYNVSGFNAILDAELADRRMRDLETHYRAVKAGNPDCILYFESAHYLSRKVRGIVYHSLARYADIMGMNEEELIAHTKEFGVDLDKENLDDVLMGMRLLLDQYEMRGIIMHTKDYSLYYGDDLPGADMEKGLTLGNLLAGTRARVGHYGTLEECRESLPYGLSEVGLRFSRELEEKHTDRKTVLVPSRYIDQPTCTIGLGDTFVAGVQFAFIR